MIHQNRPNSIMTQKGHLKRLRKGLRSTNIYSVLETDDIEEDAVDSASDDDQFTDSEAESIDTTHNNNKLKLSSSKLYSYNNNTFNLQYHYLFMPPWATLFNHRK
jgi:hypothetical protein